MSGADLTVLAAHLGAETTEVLAALDASGLAAWSTATPSPGWTVADQVAHLAYFDEAATASVGGAATFAPYLDEARRLGASLPDDVAARSRGRSPDDLRAWWVGARAAMLDAMLAAGPSARVAWYGPDFSVASALSGRLMETWAHGDDVFEALGAPHRETAALYDVARLCARTRANSYAAQGRAAPDVEVAVVLDASSGDVWRFGEGTEEIRGRAVEFCLVATQRRHPSDTALVATGPAAAEWLSIAQAFAGAPGEGRAPSGSTGP